jgi:4-hydroxy-tetrahydrodipicolinate reductase
MINVSVNGALGRMGSTVCNAVINDSEMELTDSVDINSKNHKTPNGKLIHKDFSEILSNNPPDIIVDFTNRETFLNLTKLLIPKKINIVSGSTGLLDEDYEKIAQQCAKYKIGVLSASNFAIGAVLMMKLAGIAGKYFDYADLLESHHEKKIDAPSGTAISIAEAASSNRDQKYSQNILEKETIKNTRGGSLNGVQIHSSRMPGRVARHELVFGGLGQTFTMIHDSIDRDSFMPGVILGVKEIIKKQNLVVGLDKIMGI